jgi:hypothetical protein
VTSCTLIAVTDVSVKPVLFVRLDWTSEHFYQTAVGRRGTFELRKNCPISTTNRMWIALRLNPGISKRIRHEKIVVTCHESTELICPSAPTWHPGIHVTAPFFVVLRLNAYLSRFPVKQPTAPPAEPGMLCATLMPGVSVYT